MGKTTQQRVDSIMLRGVAMKITFRWRNLLPLVCTTLGLMAAAVLVNVIAGMPVTNILKGMAFGLLAATAIIGVWLLGEVAIAWWRVQSFSFGRRRLG